MKLIILDRDGVINQDRKDYVKSAEEWQALPGSLDAIARLNGAGCKVAIATNQSGLGRGLFTIHDFIAMQQKMNHQLKAAGGSIDAVFFCPHRPDEHCRCRKPAPGLFEQILHHYKIEDPASVTAVGDSLRDLQAAAAAGCSPHLVLTGNGLRTLEDPACPNVPHSKDLHEFAEHFLQQHSD